MTEFDQLVAHRGVLMAGRFDPDWRVGEQKTKALFFEYPAAAQAMGTYCQAIQSVLNALALSMDGISPMNWSPIHGWAVSAGDFSVAMHGDRFVVAETAQIESVDELLRLLAQ